MARPKSYKIGVRGKFHGKKIFYSGFTDRPKFLKDGGRGFSGLTHILQHLDRRLKKYRLIITAHGTDSLSKDGARYRVQLSAKTIRSIFGLKLERNKHLMLGITQQLLHKSFPRHFDKSVHHQYLKGMFVDILTETFDPRVLDAADKAALTNYLARDVGGQAAIDIPTAYKKSRDTQLLYLHKLISEFEGALGEGRGESWWQTYFSKRILFFQDNYIRHIEKLNVSLGTSKFPDFIVATSDGYLDVIEIKTPDTVLLREDKSHHNFYWAPEISKAISQVENYIDRITKSSDAIRNALRDEYRLDFQIIKPRGLIIAGNSTAFSGTRKKADDFRLLNEALKNMEIVPYNELSQRLRNTAVSLQKLSATMQTRR